SQSSSSVLVLSRRHSLDGDEQVMEATGARKASFISDGRCRHHTGFQELLSMLHGDVLQKLLRTGPSQISEHALKMCRTNAHVTGDLFQSRLRSVPCPNKIDSVGDTSVIKRFLWF